MLSAIRRFKTLVSQGLPYLNLEDDNEQHTQYKVRFKTAKSKSGRCLNIVNPDEGGDAIQGADEVVKPMIWNVDMEELGTDDEDAQTKVLRLFRFRILHLACNMDPSPASSLDKTDIRYKPSPDFDTVKACRLVCKDWNDEVAAIFLTVGKPLLSFDPVFALQKQRRQGAVQDAQSILEVLRYSLVRPALLQASNSDLTVPPIKLHLPCSFFYKQVENTFIHSIIPHIERHIFELQCYLPADSTMKYYWPALKLDNLRKIKFKCTNDTQSKLGGLSYLHQNPFTHGNYMHMIQQILNGAANAESLTIRCYAPHFAPGLYRVILPKGLTFLDVPIVKMTPEEYADCVQYNACCTCKNLKHLVMRSPMKTYRREEEVSPCHGAFLLEKYGETLEKLELDVSGQEMDHLIWTMRSDYVYEPLRLEIVKPLRKVKTLSLHAGNWEVNMMDYQTALPAVRSLSLTLITREDQIRSLYENRSDTVEKLKLSFVLELTYDVVRGFADNLPWLRELDIIVKERFSGLGICFQGFHRLRKLHVVYAGCNSQEATDMLNWAVTGIPMETLRALAKGETTILEAIKAHEDNPSLRNLTELEELKLQVKSNYRMDTSIMLRAAFLRMSRLKKVFLTEKTMMIEDDQKDYIRKENQYGLTFEWI